MRDAVRRHVAALPARAPACGRSRGVLSAPRRAVFRLRGLLPRAGRLAHRGALGARGVVQLAGKHHARQAGGADVQRNAGPQDQRADREARQRGQHLQSRRRDEVDAGDWRWQRGLHHHVVARRHIVRAKDQSGILRGRPVERQIDVLPGVRWHRSSRSFSRGSPTPSGRHRPNRDWCWPASHRHRHRCRCNRGRAPSSRRR